MRFSIGSHVKLADYTGDNQIDYYYGKVLEVVEYSPILARIAGTLHDIPNYRLVSIDNRYHTFTANEYELEAV